MTLSILKVLGLQDLYAQKPEQHFTVSHLRSKFLIKKKNSPPKNFTLNTKIKCILGACKENSCVGNAQQRA